MRKSGLSNEQRWKRLVSGQDSSWRKTLVLPPLKALGALYGSIIGLRSALYAKGFLKRYWPGAYVISVGNITVGGTGKTPVVALIARALKEGGRHVAIVSRGYKSRKPSLKYRLKHGGDWSGTRVVSDGKSTLLSPRLAGDEPYMLSLNLPGVVVVTDPDRVRGARYAMREFQSDTIILDDGLQHLRMRRQKDIVLLDATCPFGYGRILPAGLLREPVEGLERAHLIILTKSENLTPGQRQDIEAEIRLYNKKAPIIACHYEPTELVSVHTGKKAPLSLLNGLPVMAITGIAQPEGFRKLLESQGADIVCRRYFPDHHRFKRSEIETVYETAANFGAQAIVLTEKDAVRFPLSARPKDQKTKDIPVYYAKVQLKFPNPEDQAVLIHQLEEICNN